MDFNEGQRYYKVHIKSVREGTLLQESTDESTKLATKLHVVSSLCDRTCILNFFVVVMSHTFCTRE